MDSLETIGRRIATTGNLQSIVRTMKSLSAVSIRQYEEAAEALRQYSETIELGLHVVLTHRAMAAPVSEVSDGRTVLIVFGSDHGLCGRFNEQIARFACAEAGRMSPNADRRLWLSVGARAAARLEAAGEAVETCYVLPGAVGGLTATAHNILLQIDAWRERHQIARVVLFHNGRADGATAAPRSVPLLPLDADWLRRLTEMRWPSRRLPTFAMDDGALLSFLIRQHLFVVIFRAGVESIASEHATRLASMQAAERNIDDHLDEMNAAFRLKRQQSITEEMLDVVAGYETLMASGD